MKINYIPFGTQGKGEELTQFFQKQAHKTIEKLVLGKVVTQEPKEEKKKYVQSSHIPRYMQSIKRDPNRHQ